MASLAAVWTDSNRSWRSGTNWVMVRFLVPLNSLIVAE